MLRGQTELEFTSNFGLTPTKDADYRFDLRRGHPGSEIADSAVELQIGQQRVVVGVVEVVLSSGRAGSRVTSSSARPRAVAGDVLPIHPDLPD